MPDKKDKYAAGEQGLGYIYQPRFALLRLLQLPEDTSVFIEKDDDLDFIDQHGSKTLASLKHKADGDKLTNLSTDFWKSVNIWLDRYNRDGGPESNLNFFLFSTGTVVETSFLRYFLSGYLLRADDPSLSSLANDALSSSTSTLISPIAKKFDLLDGEKKEDFLSRIQIFDNSPRITDIPNTIKEQYMRTIRREFRESVFNRLEGWWNDVVIDLLSGKRLDAIQGHEVSEKLSLFADEYKTDNLPITFQGAMPHYDIETETDSRQFVVQLREIGVTSSRIRNAILDYYRAFEQRSAWARENLLSLGEMEKYEDRLVDEWTRYKDMIFEELDEKSTNAVVTSAGKKLYDWADLSSGNLSSLRIRERVSEPYVVRGGFHILANARLSPRIYWHPHFLNRLSSILGVAK